MLEYKLHNAFGKHACFVWFGRQVRNRRNSELKSAKEKQGSLETKRRRNVKAAESLLQSRIGGLSLPKSRRIPEHTLSAQRARRGRFRSKCQKRRQSGHQAHPPSQASSRRGRLSERVLQPAAPRPRLREVSVQVPSGEGQDLLALHLWILKHPSRSLTAADAAIRSVELD